MIFFSIWWPFFIDILLIYLKGKMTEAETEAEIQLDKREKLGWAVLPSCWYTLQMITASEQGQAEARSLELQLCYCEGDSDLRI